MPPAICASTTAKHPRARRSSPISLGFPKLKRPFRSKCPIAGPAILEVDLDEAIRALASELLLPHRPHQLPPAALPKRCCSLLRTVPVSKLCGAGANVTRKQFPKAAEPPAAPRSSGQAFSGRLTRKDGQAGRVRPRERGPGQRGVLLGPAPQGLARARRGGVPKEPEPEAQGAGAGTRTARRAPNRL